MTDHLKYFTKLRLLAVILSAVAAIVVGVAKIHIVKDVYPTRTQYVPTPAPHGVPDGYMTDDQCRTLANTSVTRRQVVYLYGPSLDKDFDMWGIRATKHKPVTRYCSINFTLTGHVESVSLDLPMTGKPRI